MTSNTFRCMGAVMAWLVAASIVHAQTWQGSGTGGDTTTSGGTTLYTNGANWSGSTVPATSGVTTATIDFGNAGLVDLTGTRSLGSGAGSVGNLTVLDAVVSNGVIQIGALGGQGSLLVSNSTMYAGLFLAQSNGSFVSATIIDSTINFSNNLIELSRPMASGHIATSQILAVNSTLVGGILRTGEGVGSPGTLANSFLRMTNSVLRNTSIRINTGFRIEAVDSTLTNVDFVGGADMRIYATNSTIWTRTGAGLVRIGGFNTATMQLNGGLLRVNDSMTIGGQAANQPGTLVLNNTMNTNRVTGSTFRVGGDAAGAGGTLALTNSFLQVANPSIGTTVASGSVHLVNSTLKAEGVVRFGTNAFVVAQNSVIELSDGTFDNRMTDTANWETATNLTLRALRVTATNFLEAAGQDYGANDGRFADNFALGTLHITNHPCCGAPRALRLINSFDNNPTSDRTEAVYVYKLIMDNNTALDLNGLNLYTFEFMQGTGTTIINGSVTLVTIPEPSALCLLVLGTGCLWFRRRHKS